MQRAFVFVGIGKNNVKCVNRNHETVVNQNRRVIANFELSKDAEQRYRNAAKENCLRLLMINRRDNAYTSRCSAAIPRRRRVLNAQRAGRWTKAPRHNDRTTGQKQHER
jgi:hypothetical protein